MAVICIGQERPQLTTQARMAVCNTGEDGHVYVMVLRNTEVRRWSYRPIVEAFCSALSRTSVASPSCLRARVTVAPVPMLLSYICIHLCHWSKPLFTHFYKRSLMKIWRCGKTCGTTCGRRKFVVSPQVSHAEIAHNIQCIASENVHKN